jgi:metal-dependent amidase/aminoacylase/carboxypeptidase family protein
MSAARLSSALVRRVALGLAGTGASAVIEDVKRDIRVTIVANPDALPIPSDEGVDAWDKAVGIER